MTTNHTTHEDATEGTAAPSGLRSELDGAKDSTLPLRLQLTPEDMARDLAARHWAFLELLKRQMDACAESYDSL